MYGAIHRAQLGDHGNLRGIVIDSKLLAEPAFHAALTDPAAVARVSQLAHPSIVSTVAVESSATAVVVVTRGAGRYVTVQDLITAARANRTAGKLAPSLAATIARAVVEALATAHAAGVVHGAVHPRSVVVDEEGHVRLGDFVIARALTIAVARGADSALCRGLTGYLAPELVVGEEPNPQTDVFAVGALLFNMLSGETPPGALRSTPAVERLVHRALDTDPKRRYRHAGDLFENLLEAFEDDRWTFAPEREVIRAAGLSRTDTNVDEATEDLLASLGSSGMQVTSTDQRAERVAARHAITPTGANRLDALLADLDEKSEMTEVDSQHRGRGMDPISEIIKADPQRQAVLATPARGRRVPTFEDVDDEDEPGPPRRKSSEAYSDTIPPPQLGPEVTGTPRSGTRDEAAAMDALSGLDEPVRRVSSAASVAEQAALKLEEAARRAEAAAARVGDSQPVRRPLAPAGLPAEPMPDLDVRPPRLKSRLVGIISLLLLVGGGVAFVIVYRNQQAANEQREQDRLAQKAAHEAEEKRLTEAQIDAGSLVMTSSPSEAGVWLRIGRTPVETMRLRADHTHDLALLLDGHELVEVQVGASHWQGAGADQKATVTATLPVLKRPKDKKAKARRAALPMQPTAVFAKTAGTGAGRIRIETTPPDAEAYLFVGVTGTMRFKQLTAGRDYELVVVKDGFKPRHVTIKSEEWRDGGNPDIPIDAAKKKMTIEKSVDLEPLPEKP